MVMLASLPTLKNHMSAGNVAGNETGNVKRLILSIGSETLTREEIMKRLGLKGSGNFRAAYLYPALEKGYVSKLYPESEKRRDQAYYLTEKGIRLLVETHLKSGIFRVP